MLSDRCFKIRKGHELRTIEVCCSLTKNVNRGIIVFSENNLRSGLLPGGKLTGNAEERKGSDWLRNPV